MNFIKESLLNNLVALEEFAKELANQIKPGTAIGFSGPLGAGKTTLISFICSQLGTTVQISSPSYVLHHEYAARDNIIIDHWDLYRVNQLPDELTSECPNNRIWLIEWPERAGNMLEWLDILISIDFTATNLQRFARVESKIDLSL